MRMMDATPISFGPEQRHSPRVVVCASAQVCVKGETSEHMTFDLSTGGVRLCGIPTGQAGDSARLCLRLPRSVVTTLGRIVRVGERGAQPSFALQFVQLSADAEEAIEVAVEDALRAPGKRSILLLKSKSPRACGPAWLAPVSPICASAHTALDAVQHLADHRIRYGVIGKSTWGTSNAAWAEVFPSIEWRTIDAWGRLHRDLYESHDVDPEADLDGREAASLSPESAEVVG